MATQTDAQLLGAYCWNLAIVGAFYPLIQLVEVALRNALHHVASSKYQGANNEHWFGIVPCRQANDENGQPITAEQVRKFHDCIKNAKKSAKRTLESKGIASPIPTVDQVISQCDFATWEYLLDKHFYDGSDKNFFGHMSLQKSFANFPE